MKISYDNNINNSCVVLGVTESEQIVLYESRMICENIIPHLLIAERKDINNTTEFYYYTNNHLSLKRKCERGELEGSDIYTLIDSLVNMGKYLEDYLLTENHLILWPDTIFYETNKGCVEFLYYPCNVGSIEESLVKLSEFIIYHVNHNEMKAVKLAYKFYDMVNNKDFAFDILLEQYKLNYCTYEDKNEEENETENVEDITNIHEDRDVTENFIRRNHFFSIIIIASVLCIMAILGKIY